MSALSVIETSIMLGLFVLLAGGYALLYGAAQLRGSRALVYAAYACYALQGAVTLALIAISSLALGWLILIVASYVACYKVPHITWSYLNLIHRME